MLFLVGTLVLIGHGTASAGPQLSVYDSPHYKIYTDLGRDVGREAIVRMTEMFEEYRRRTSAFSVKIREKLPFYLFRNRSDYVAAGGPLGSIGVFTGDGLLAVMGDAGRVGGVPDAPSFSWGTVQHEGFHQFVHVVIGRALPVWVNEGMAEYFGQAVFTGDGYVAGLIPPARLTRIKHMIRGGAHRPVAEMMRVKRREWNQRMSSTDYLQAWSMVHFLAHGDGGKYEGSFNAFLREAGRTGVWDKAWAKHFGPDLAEFEAAWRTYWLGLPPAPTADRYAQTIVATLTSFWARAVSRKQTYASIDAFFQEARAGTLRVHAEDWLPPSLLKSALDRVEQTGTWSLGKGPRPELICVTPDGTRIVGTFVLRGRRVAKVSLAIETR